MRALPFISCITLAFAVVAGAASPVWPQIPRLVPQVPQIFEDYSSLYARIVADQRLGSPYDEGLVRNLQAHSTVEHFPDRSANPIAVLKVELLNEDGSSRMRSKYGNYPFYVVRETPSGLVLLGSMFGRTYRSAVRAGKREFFVEEHRPTDRVVQMHFRVEDSRLVNLSAPAPKSDAPIAVAAR